MNLVSLSKTGLYKMSEMWTGWVYKKCTVSHSFSHNNFGPVITLKMEGHGIH